MTQLVCTWELYTYSEPAATQQHGIKKTAPEITATKIQGNISRAWYFYSLTLTPHRAMFCKVKHVEAFIWIQQKLKGRIKIRIPVSSRVQSNNHMDMKYLLHFLAYIEVSVRGNKACLTQMYLRDLAEVSKWFFVSFLVLFYYDSQSRKTFFFYRQGCSSDRL